MAGNFSADRPSATLLTLAAGLGRAETVENAVSHTIDLAEVVFEQPVVAAYEYDPPGDTMTLIQSSTADSKQSDRVQDKLAQSADDVLANQEQDDQIAEIPQATVNTNPPAPLQTNVLVPVGPTSVLSLGTTDQDGFDDADVAAIEGLAATLETALARINRNRSAATDRQGDLQRTVSQAEDDAAALRRLNELTADSEEFDETVEQLLSLGCDYFGLDTGILSRVHEDNYEIEAVVDATETHEAGAVYDFRETMCQATLTSSVTEPLAFADVAETDHQNHLAAEDVRAYIAAPVIVDGETYGTVNFSAGTRRSQTFRSEEEEFVKLISQWVGTEIERRHQVAELERYETILEAVDDPVYALDAAGQFTFINTAAKREFGYGAEIIGKRPSIGMDESDVNRIREQITELIGADKRSTMAEFELNTADGGRKVVENRLALIGDGEFRGTAGVLRDVTAREHRQRQLESFQRAIEEAADGVAILDGDTYTYIDKSHLDMYGFDDEEQLLGKTWRELYDDEEIERLEREAFPTLESEGYWRGMVTGSRQDGSTFPAELSLSIVDDGRLVCTVRDETERKARERELELKERAMNEANVSIQITDPTQEGNPLVYVNDAFEQMTGYTRSEAMGRNPRFLQGEATDPAKRAQLRDAIKAEEPVSLELQNERKDGTPYWTRISITPVTDGSGSVSNYIGIQQDVTERRERERQTKARKDFLKRIYEVTTDPELPFEKKITGLLEAGRDHLNLPYGFLTRIEKGDEEGSGTQTIVEALGSHELLQPGKSAPLEQSYCRKTIEQNGLMTHTHAAEEGWAEDLPHETFELETYIGGEVVAGDDLYGTLCFASQEPRDHSFDEFERSFIRLAGRWAGYEIDRRNTREELKEQRERLELTLSGTNTGLAEWDLETDAVTWNETLVDIVGQDVSTIEEFRAAVHPDDRDRVQRELETMVETGEPWTGEFRILDDDGETLWLGTRATSVYNSDGEPVRVLATGTDISDRKEREQALEESQERYQTLLEASPDPLFVADAETGDIVEANAAAEELLGRPRGEIIGRSQTELHPEGDAELYREAFEQSVGRREVISELPDGTQPELRAADGETVPVEINADTVALPRGPVMYGVFRDISQRRERERELKLKERAMDEANLGITISDPDQEDNPLIYANDGFVEQTGYTRADAVGRNCRFLQADDRDQQALDTLRDAITAEEATTVELRNYRKDGEQFWNRLSVTPVYDDHGMLRNYIGIQQEVTEAKTREQRLQALLGTTRELIGMDSIEDATAGAVETLATEFGFHQAAFYRKEDAELVQMAATGESTAQPPERIERGRSPLWEVVETGEPVTYDDCTEISDHIDRGDVTAGAYFPVGEHGVVVVGAEDADHLGESECRLIEVLSSNLASVLKTIERQRELFEERERFRLLTESVDEYAFLVVDENGTVQTWNEGAENLFGYDADVAVGMPMAAFHPEADRESGLPERLLQQARVAGESSHEGWRVRADGSEFYADVRYAPLEADDGEFRGYAKIVRDMTNQRRQRRRTEQFVEESDDVVTIVDEDGTITYASGSADRVLGYDADDLVGENLFDYLHPDGREDAMETFFAGMENPDADSQAECRIRSADGEWLNIEGQCRNMLDDDAIGGMLLYLRDVTESKERTRRFESIFNQTFQFTGLLEPNGTVIEANDAALEFGGVERDAIAGNPFYEAPWWTHSEAVRENVRDAIERAADGEFVRYETEVRGADGLATIDFSVKPVTDDDDDVSLLVVEGRDITAQQQQQQHLDVMQRVMRHNMRNDLTKVRGWTQVMSEESNAEKRAEQFETVERILDKWDEMTEKMKQMRQVIRSEGNEQYTSEAESLLETAVAPVREEHVDATITTDVADAASVQVPTGVTEAVRELVNNAADATEAGTIEVELDRPAEGWIEINVSDDGPGMPEMEVDVLETGEETPLSHGGGLGLWMVRTIVTQAGGEVQVESTADGTEVCLRLPTERTAESAGL